MEHFLSHRKSRLQLLTTEVGSLCLSFYKPIPHTPNRFNALPSGQLQQDLPKLTDVIPDGLANLDRLCVLPDQRIDLGFWKGSAGVSGQQVEYLKLLAT